MNRTRKPRTDLFRVGVSWLVAFTVMIAVGVVLWATDGIDFSDARQTIVVAYVVMWPVYAVVYVWWSIRAYTRLDEGELRRLSVTELRERRGWAQKVFGQSSANTSLSAASVAVLVTVLIAVQPVFRGEVVYLALGLLTVAASWVLMVFSFAQAYLHLEFGREGVSHLGFRVPETPDFNDFLTLSALISTMAVTTPAEPKTRPGWRLLRLNVLIAFVFNSVIIAMIVSLLFGGLLG